MFADQLRRAVEASPRANLSHVSSLLWRAYGAGHVTEAEAEELSGLIEARKAVKAPQKPAQRPVGTRPRTDASMDRRRRWASSGAMPPQLQARFTLAESAVLAMVAAEVASKGACTLTIGHIAALAGVSETTVRNALREAVQLGYVRVEERRVSAWRNLSNKVTIASPEWNAWLRLRLRRRGALGSHAPGCKLANPTHTEDKDRTAYRPQKASKRGGAKGSPTPETVQIECWRSARGPHAGLTRQDVFRPPYDR